MRFNRTAARRRHRSSGVAARRRAKPPSCVSPRRPAERSAGLAATGDRPAGKPDGGDPAIPVKRAAHGTQNRRSCSGRTHRCQRDVPAVCHRAGDEHPQHRQARALDRALALGCRDAHAHAIAPLPPHAFAAGAKDRRRVAPGGGFSKRLSRISVPSLRSLQWPGHAHARARRVLTDGETKGRSSCGLPTVPPIHPAERCPVGCR